MKYEIQEIVVAQAMILKWLAEGVYIIDKSDAIVLTNPALDLMFGYERGELLGQSASVLCDHTAKDQALIKSAMQNTLKNCGYWAGEFNARKKDGSSFITSVRIATGNASGKEFCICIHTDMTSLKQAEAARLQLLQKLEKVQEAERYRLSRELHDQIGQDLTVLTLSLQSLKKVVSSNPEVVTQLEYLIKVAHQIGQQAHDIATELRPKALDELGLQMALMNFVERWSARTGINVDFRVVGLDQDRLPPMIETTAYRIIQEALANVLKHANARNVVISLGRHSEQLIAVIADDGRGFDVEAVKGRAELEQRLGLLGMRERVVLVGGVLDIESMPGTGASIALRIPLAYSNFGFDVQKASC
jgi:two-component system, NarL family, sensor histidine kinase UhpB